jgi:uncharacterized protein (TIGR00255 family)
MTGYGSVERDGFRVEVRSVNHRFLDMNFRMPPYLQPYEMELRGVVKKYVQRGRLDVRVSLTEGADIRLRINREFGRSLFNALSELKGELSLEGEPSIENLFWFRDLIFEEEPGYDSDLLIAVFQEAMERLVEMRKSEGEHLRSVILRGIQLLERYLQEVEELASQALPELMKKLREKIKDLTGEGVDESRLIQEAAFLAERADVEEEIHRIRSHSGQLRKIISQGGTIGRKADFILQELLREANTIGSKCSDYAISERVVNMKSEIERMKEQVQNIQ